MEKKVDKRWERQKKKDRKKKQQKKRDKYNKKGRTIESKIRKRERK